VATLPEEYITEGERSVARFMRTKGPNAKDIHKEMFPVYVVKCFSRKAVHHRVVNVSLMTKRLKRRCGSDRDSRKKKKKTSMLRVSTHG
jgi:hypothetical protein